MSEIRAKRATATCEGEREDEEDIWKKRRVELHSDLRSMVNRPESSDVVFECNDGIRIHAIRLILFSRCSVFKVMLSNGMLETNMPVVSLPKFSSPVMLSIMEYLYTGAIESYCLSSWKMGCELISAAQFFIIPAVEECAQKFLLAQFNVNTEKSRLLEMLSIALEFAETWKGKNKMLRKLVSYIGPNWYDDDFCHKLTRKAVEFIVCSSERDSGIGDSDSSVKEYFTFRKIVLWHVHQALSGGTVLAKGALEGILPSPVLAKGTLEGILPGGDPSEPSVWQKILNVPVQIDTFLLNASTSTESFDSSATLNRLLGTKVCKDSLGQLLTHINLALIPASILLKVIHPLRIVPSQQLLKALVHIAVNTHSLARFDWKHGPGLKIGSDGEIVCSSEDGKRRGIGIAAISSPRSSDVLEWTFRILDNDAGAIELGFLCERNGDHLTGGVHEGLNSNLCNQSTSRVLYVSRSRKQTYVSRELPIISVDKFWESWECFNGQVGLNSDVKFQLNVLERTCSVSFGKSFRAEWEGLPDGDYHPAVGFCMSTSARVELKLVRGFDSL